MMAMTNGDAGRTCSGYPPASPLAHYNHIYLSYYHGAQLVYGLLFQMSRRVHAVGSYHYGLMGVHESCTNKEYIK